jgi:hypothetical protein
MLRQRPSANGEPGRRALYRRIALYRESEPVIALLLVVILIAAVWALAYHRLSAPVWTLVLGSIVGVRC